MSKKQNRQKRERQERARQRKQKQPTQDAPFGHCEVCETPLMTEGGCEGTGLCGPCCLGEADTVGEY